MEVVVLEELCQEKSICYGPVEQVVVVESEEGLLAGLFSALLSQQLAPPPPL